MAGASDIIVSFEVWAAALAPSMVQTSAIRNSEVCDRSSDHRLHRSAVRFGQSWPDRLEDQMAISAEGRTAVVTGGARGIGAATARRLAADGFAVAVLDLDETGAKATAESIVTGGGRAAGVAVDVADAEAVSVAVEQVVTELDAPTVLVNNAGVTRDNLLFKLSEADWDTVMGVHLRGAFLMTRAVQRYMVAAGWGRVVNLSSVSALGNRGQANYSTAKAGHPGLHQDRGHRAGQVRRHGQRDRPGLHRHRDDPRHRRAGRRRRSTSTPPSRPRTSRSVASVEPEDVANVVSFLVSEQAGFVSGQVIYVAGGPKA